jgi:hypothetical protein
MAPLTPPAPPNGLVIVVTAHTVGLHWRPSASEHPVSWVVQAGSGRGLSDLANFRMRSSAPSVVVTDVPSGIYHFRVVAENENGTSEPSNEVQASVDMLCVNHSGSPSELTANQNGSVVGLTWRPSLTGCPATNYLVEAGSTPGSRDLATFLTGAVITAAAMRVNATGKYYFRVRARTGPATSEPSNEISITIPASGNARDEGAFGVPGTKSAAPIARALFFGFPAPAPSQPSAPSGTGTFSYGAIVSGAVSTLSAFIQSVSPNGTVVVNGSDSAAPTRPFTFSWGDGTVSAGFFPQQHIYADVSRNYSINITATENNGVTGTFVLSAAFRAATVTLQNVASDVTVTIPSQLSPLQTHYPYSPPSNVAAFADSDFGTPYSRTATQNILTVAAAIDKNMANDNVFLSNGTFTMTMLKVTDFSGGASFWYTTPMSMGFSQNVLGQWFVLFNELGKNTTLNTPTTFPFGGHTDGNASEIYSETLGDIFSYASGYELINHAAFYGIGPDVATDIGNSMLAGAASLRATFDAYLRAGAPFNSWNPYNGGLDPTLGAVTALSWKFIEHAERRGQGFWLPTKRLMTLLQTFNSSMLAMYAPQANTVAAANFRATLMVTAISYAFSEDLRDEFRGLNFPVDDAIYAQLMAFVP